MHRHHHVTGVVLNYLIMLAYVAAGFIVGTAAIWGVCTVAYNLGLYGVIA